MKNNVYLIKDYEAAMDSEMRGDGATYYCDRSGKIYRTDLVVVGAEARKAATQSGAEILAQFRDMKAIVYFGAELYEGRQIASLAHIEHQMTQNGFNRTNRARVIEAHRNFSGVVPV